MTSVQARSGVKRDVPAAHNERGRVSTAKTKPKEIDMRGSIAASLNITTGTKLHAKELSNQRVTEEQLVLAGTFNRLSKIGRNLARRFIHEVGDTWQKLKTNGETLSLFKSIDSEIKELVAEGKVKANHAEKILRHALGQGNLDQDVTNLDPRRRHLTDGARDKHARTNIDRVLSVMGGNRSATQTELDELRKKNIRGNRNVFDNRTTDKHGRGGRARSPPRPGRRGNPFQ